MGAVLRYRMLRKKYVVNLWPAMRFSLGSPVCLEAAAAILLQCNI